MAGGKKTSKEERRRKALETWVNNPLMSYEQIAEAAGISSKSRRLTVPL